MSALLWLFIFTTSRHGNSDHPLSFRFSACGTTQTPLRCDRDGGRSRPAPSVVAGCFDTKTDFPKKFY